MHRKRQKLPFHRRKTVRQTDLDARPCRRKRGGRTNCFPDTSNKASSAVLEGLEKVADYCDKLDIALVKINDLELVSWF